MKEILTFNDVFDKGFNEIYNNLLGFGAPTRIRFNTGNTKDMNPAYWSVWEDYVPDSTEKVKLGYKAVCRTVGIREEDVKIILTSYGICLDGCTEIDEQKYTQHIELPISREVMRDIDEITYHSRDGLTYIYLKMKISYPREVPIRKIPIMDKKDYETKKISNNIESDVNKEQNQEWFGNFDK